MQLSINASESLAIIDKHIIYSKTDARGVITEVSSAFSEISGYTKDELLGQPHNIVRHPDNPSGFFREIWETIQAGNSWQGEIRNRKKDGETYYVYSTITPEKDEQDNIIGYISIRQDITHQKIAEAQKSILIQQSKLASMGEMLNNITHQWRQPLTVLSLKIQLLRDSYNHNELSAETFQKTTSKMLDYTNHMNQTIDDFKNFFSPGKVSSTFNPFKSIDYVHSIFKSRFNECQIEFNIKEVSTVSIEGFENEFMQVLMNIIGNACDQILLTRTSSGKITVMLETDNAAHHVIIRIRDNAGGVPADMLPDKLFEQYTSTKGEKGTGIGLFMSRMIIEEHMHGKLWVQNVENGAEFVIELPLIHH